MRYDEMIDSMWDSFLFYRLKFSHLEDDRSNKAAFYWAIKDNVSKIYSSYYIDALALEHGGDDYIKYSEENLGFEIGKQINESPDHYKEINREELMGKRLIKEVFIVKLRDKK